MSGSVGSRFDKLAHSQERWHGYLAKIRAQDAQALARLYDETSSILYGLALRILADPAVAEEVMLDVYQRLWTAQAIEGSVLAYLTSLIRSCAFDRLQASGARAASKSASFKLKTGFRAFVSYDETESASETVSIFGRERKLVQRALESLPSEQRDAIELAFFGGLTDVELAQALGAPLLAVKKRICLGMNKLRQVLESVASLENSA